MEDVRLLVMEERWVIAAEIVGMSPCGLFLDLGWSAVVVLWGTDFGLGQLAREGPRPNTKLNPEPDGGQVSRRHIMRSVKCDPAKWRRAIEPER